MQSKAKFGWTPHYRYVIWASVLLIGTACNQQTIPPLPPGTPTLIAHVPTPVIPPITPTSKPTELPSFPTATNTITPSSTTLLNQTAQPTQTVVTPPLSLTTNVLGQPLPPFQPLRDERVVDRPFRNLRALTDGSRKYKTVLWSPTSEWLAMTPQDGPGIDMVNSLTGRVFAVVTDTYVLEPNWGWSSANDTNRPQVTCLLVPQLTDGEYYVDSFSSIPAAPSPCFEWSWGETPIQALAVAPYAFAYSQANQLTIIATEGYDDKQTLPSGAFSIDISERQEPYVAWTPLVNNLADVQTLVYKRGRSDQIGIVHAASLPGEGWWQPQLTGDGDKLAVTSIGGRLGTMPIDVTLRFDLGPGDTPVWSADGERIAFAGTSAGLDYTSRDIHVVDWQGIGPRLRLTRANSEQIYVSPSWSPDGKQIAFIEIDSGQVFVGDAP